MGSFFCFSTYAEGGRLGNPDIFAYVLDEWPPITQQKGIIHTITHTYRISSNLMRPLFSADFEKNNFSIFLFSADRYPVRTKCLLIDLNVCVLMCFDCFNRSNLVRFFLK